MRLTHSLLFLTVWLIATPSRSETPPVVDLREHQSPLVSQGGRTSCTYHPPISALEAAYRRQGVKVDLSVEHLIWLRNVTALNTSVKDPKVNENNLAFLTGGGLSVNFDLLARYGVSRAEHFPFLHDHEDYKSAHYRGFDVTDYQWFKPHRQLSLNRFNLDPRQLPDAARRDARYGIKDYVFFGGSACQDVGKIEEILASGREVAVNVFVSYPHDPKDKSRGNIPPVVWYVPKGAAPKQADSHAMLIVGYDRPRQFFIVKNSWGATRNGYEPEKLPEGWKDIAKYKGYTLMHYNYLQGNREAAYIQEVAEPGDTRFDRQRALGLWQFRVEEKESKKSVVEGVLAWRRTPDVSKGSLRVGDFYGPEGKECRVNAAWPAEDTSKITLFIDFDRPQLEFNQRHGVEFRGILVVPPRGPASVTAGEVVLRKGEKQLFGHPASDLTFRAEQLIEGNSLLNWGSPAVRPEKTTSAQEMSPIKLWSGKAPHAVGDDPVDVPTLTPWLPPQEKRTGAAIVVCPGGGYGALAMDHEGKQIAQWLNARGIAAFVLKYRVATKNRPGPLHPAPLLDAQRAVRTVRARASEWGVLPNKVGIWGFSAGGHLASTAATHFDAGNSTAGDIVERVSCRPDFAILCYPVISMKAPHTHGGSRNNLLGKEADPQLVETLCNDQAVTKETPPTFLFHTDEDTPVPPMNSVLFYAALKKHGVPAELHIYEKGKHGVGLAQRIGTAERGLDRWPNLLKDWLIRRGLCSE